MDENLENKIIEFYLSGVGSTTIAKELSIQKKKILKLLKDKNLTRNRLLSEEFYGNFWEIDGKWYGNWICQVCKEKILFYVNKKHLLNRNLKNKKVCKKCSLNKQCGENNPFFGKKHSNETIKKISKTKTGVLTSDHMSKPEYRKLVSDLAKERWSNGSMEETRVKLSNLMKKRYRNGEMKSYNRSKAEDEILDILKMLNIESIPNFLIEGKIFDIYIPKFNLLIEYNGDYWHCNPNKYDSNYYHHKKNKTAKEIWDYDKNKLDLALKYDYDCIVIWETDYKKNKNIINDLIKNYDKP
jgi:hypothetical protein